MPSTTTRSLCAMIWLCQSISACETSTQPGSDAALDTAADTYVQPLFPRARARDRDNVPAEQPLTQHVHVERGSGGIGFSDIGSAFVGAQLPFGMVRPGPDTAANATAVPAGYLHASGYAYSDTHLRAFGQVHVHGVGITDYGVIGLMPSNSIDARGPVPMDKASEQFAPGYYAVTLTAEEQIRVELSATERTAYYRVRSDSASTTLHFLLRHAVPDVRVDETQARLIPSERTIVGSVRTQGAYTRRGGGVTVYFAARTRDPWLSWGSEASPGTSEASERAYVQTAPDTTIAIAISLVDEDGAVRNLESDLARHGFDFDAVREAAQQAWQQRLSSIVVQGPSQGDIENFYTSLYQASLMPTLATDVDGRFRGLDGREHTASDFTYYTDFSLWDTYRTLHPLWNLLDRPLARDFAQSLITMAEHRGSFPRWPIGTVESGGMVGEPAAIMLADAYTKNIPFDRERAVALLQRGTRREAADAFATRGYVAMEDRNWSASATMEYAYADFALAQLGVEGIPQNRYRNLFDSSQSFFRGRYSDGRFQTTNVSAWSPEYAEGNAWQYLFFAPYDVSGLAEILGGRAALRARLDHFFNETAREENTRSETLRRLLYSDWYWAGNEPDIHSMWLYSDLEAPEETVRLTHWALRARYSTAPDGLPGNDDAGTMSAWYLFAAMGFYPIAGTNEYWLGAPIFERVDVRWRDQDRNMQTFSLTHSDADSPRATIQLAGGASVSGRVRHDALLQGLSWSASQQ